MRAILEDRSRTGHDVHQAAFRPTSAGGKPCSPKHPAPFLGDASASLGSGSCRSGGLAAIRTLQGDHRCTIAARPPLPQYVTPQPVIVFAPWCVSEQTARKEALTVQGINVRAGTDLSAIPAKTRHMDIQ
ncbi:hypothetical protein [Methyloversatilis sp. RAC08]|uniref:hypothetical protein n=1 Tax=Methyloversatilis sp. RAC08 TaxID=1842540 RepID=UPI0012374B67|nr:hypothetical protein [Methyloversatilis sp. RAC08]